MYAQTGGTRYLYYASNYWFVGDTVGEANGYLSSTSTSTALCPEAVGSSLALALGVPQWDYYRSGANAGWVTGGVRVQCAPCACDAISIVLTGAAYSAQWNRAGQYEKMSTTQNGRAVYAQTGGTDYLFYSSNGYWMVGSDYTTSSGGLASESKSITHCPEAVGDSWKYYASGGWVAGGGVQVQCTGPSPPPPSPPPPSPCACDAISIALTGAAYSA